MVTTCDPDLESVLYELDTLRFKMEYLTLTKPFSPKDPSWHTVGSEAAKFVKLGEAFAEPRGDDNRRVLAHNIRKFAAPRLHYLMHMLSRYGEGDTAAAANSSYVPLPVP